MTMYALYEMSLDELDKCVQNGEDYGRPVLVTADPLEITVQVGGCASDDNCPYFEKEVEE